MKYFCLATILAAFCICPESASAWDGFDAESIELVEIETDTIPAGGEVLDIRHQESGITKSGIVQNLKHNRSTIEIVILYPDNSLHTLVMEGR